ncbi:MAG TPA: hypothetical protein VI387_09630 [Candidatus Brocadiales bacterium]|nr:hypothetical protein [Candidatus Brocadiales bacterium]
MKIRAAILAVKDWKERAFIRAELIIEEGVKTFAVETMSEVEEWLADPSVLPIIIIYDTINQEHPTQDLRHLSDLASRTPVLIITTPAEKREINFDELGFEHVIQRPIRIGDVVGSVKEILKGELI